MVPTSATPDDGEEDELLPLNLSEAEYLEIMESRKLRSHYPTFAKRFLRIKTKDGKVVPFIFNHAQMILWKAIKKQIDAGVPVRIIILKARQMGMSTFVQGYLLWKAITQEGHNGLVVAHQEDSAAELFRKIELMYRLLPEEMRLELESIKETSRQGKKLGFGGDLNTLLYVDTANNPALGRGQTFQHVHLSEQAFYNRAEEIMFGLNMSVPNSPDTTIIIESTANGMGNYFHGMWLSAVKGESSYAPVFLPWKDQEEYRLPVPEDFKLTKDERKLKREHKLDMEQMVWRRTAIMDGCDGDELKFQQENPITPEEAFLISGLPYFNRDAMKHYRHECISPQDERVVQGREGYIDVINGKPTFQDIPGGSWRIWEKPHKDRSYVIGADPSGGSARDYSGAHVVDLLSMKVVASFRGKIDPFEFARQLKWMGLAYNKALLAVEKNGEGRAVVLKLVNDMQYPRMFYHTTQEDWSGGIKQSWGWSTNMKTRPAMIAQLGEVLRERVLKLYDDRTMDDVETFVRVDGSKIATAAQGAWDDMVMSLAIATSSEVRAQGNVYRDFDDDDPAGPTVSEITGY
jgi:hypothetical protein